MAKVKGHSQGCNFWKLIGGAERGNDAQGAIKILLDTDFISDLAYFPHNTMGAQLNIGGAQALSKRYKVTPMDIQFLKSSAKGHRINTITYSGIRNQEVVSPLEPQWTP